MEGILSQCIQIYIYPTVNFKYLTVLVVDYTSWVRKKRWYGKNGVIFLLKSCLLVLVLGINPNYIV